MNDRAAHKSGFRSFPRSTWRVPVPCVFLGSWLALLASASVTPCAHADTGITGFVPALVRKLDSVRTPAHSFTGFLEVKRTPTSGQAEEVSRFNLFTRRRENNGRPAFDTLLACNEPRRDAGKLVLFTDARCWLHDPRATHPTIIPAQQLGAQAAFSESLNWSFTDDCDARLLREETLRNAGAGEHPCFVIEFTPKAERRLLPPRMLYWVDAEGRTMRAEHYASSGKLLRTIEFTKYARVLGAERVVAMRLISRGETHEMTFSNLKEEESPAEYFEVRQLSKLKLPRQP